MDHISDEWLERYSMCTLDQSQVPWVEEHLLVCQDCQDRLINTEAFIIALRKAVWVLSNEVGSGKRED